MSSEAPCVRSGAGRLLPVCQAVGPKKVVYGSIERKKICPYGRHSSARAEINPRYSVGVVFYLVFEALAMAMVPVRTISLIPMGRSRSTRAWIFEPEPVTSTA